MQDNTIKYACLIPYHSFHVYPDLFVVWHLGTVSFCSLKWLRPSFDKFTSLQEGDALALLLKTFLFQVLN